MGDLSYRTVVGTREWASWSERQCDGLLQRKRRPGPSRNKWHLVADPVHPVNDFKTLLAAMSPDQRQAVVRLVDTLHPQFEEQVEYPVVRREIYFLALGHRMDEQVLGCLKQAETAGKLDQLVDAVVHGLCERLK
jgi:hypothetical protein